MVDERQKWADRIRVLTENLEHHVYEDPPATDREKAVLYHLREAEHEMREGDTGGSDG